MNLQRYRHFLAIVDEGSFAKAALRLGISQPPLSQSIRRLERDLGVALLTRTTQKVGLTEAGAAFYPEAVVAVAAAERAMSVARAAGKSATPMRIGFVSLALFETLPQVLEQARGLNIPVQVIYASTIDQIADLAAGRLDLGFVTPPFTAAPRLQSTLIADERVMLATATDTNFGETGAGTLEAISERLIMFQRANGPELYDALLNMFHVKGLSPRIVSEAPADILVTLSLVAAGVGVAFVPAAVSRNMSVKGVSFHAMPDTDLTPKWPISLAHMPLSLTSREARLVARLKRD